MIKKLWGYPKVKAVIFMVLAIVLGVSFASYSPTDNAWNTASSEGYHNWLGAIGAYGADFLLQMMGQAAFLVPLALFTFAVFLWLHLRWVKTRGVVLFFAFLLAVWLSTTIPVKAEYAGWFKAGPGGFIGYYLAGWVSAPQGGGLILLWALCAFLFIFAFRLPAVKITKWTGKGLWWGMNKVPVHVPEKIKKPFRKRKGFFVRK